MSSRAIQRLRQERGEAGLKTNLDEIEEIEEDDEHEQQKRRKKPAFLAMLDDSDSEDVDDEEAEKEEEKFAVKNSVLGKEEVAPDKAEHDGKEDTANDKLATTSQLKDEAEPSELACRADEEEDLDAILAEFESKDEAVEDSKPSAPWFYPIVQNMDARDLDIDFVMRTSLLGGTEEGSAPTPSASRRSRQSFLFGPPRDGWVRPPHFVGGGIVMTSYDNAQQGSNDIPWPYSAPCPENDVSPLLAAYEQWLNPRHWFTYVHSDTYKKDLQDYERIQNSGDVNALALFVAHHPFVVEALLQLAMVLYRTNQSQEGLSLLRRSLWILECSSLPSFCPLQGAMCFMDYDRPENVPLFSALFRLIQISGMQGCIRTSLGVSRYLLALDPLRDPMGTLLLLDYFALALQSSKYDILLVSLVESDKLTLHYKDESSGREYRSDLVELPNWAYSYALALYRLSKSNDALLSEKSNDALQSAIRKFPSVVEQLLIKNDVDTTGRSMRSDWPTALHDLRGYATCPVDSENYDPITQHAASQASDLISKIFVQRSHALWKGDDVLTWLFSNCRNSIPNGDASKCLVRPQLSVTLVRYARCDPSDYEDRFQTLPMDANPLDPGLLAPALAVDPNRRRLLRRADMPDARAQEEEVPAIFRGGAGLVVGGPPTGVIDPDDPLVEVLWRSMLPWNRVQGVPPPPR